MVALLLLLSAPGDNLQALDTFYADLQAAKAESRGDPALYVRRATLLAEKALTSESWPHVKTSLERQGFRLQRDVGYGDWTTYLRSSGLDMALGGDLKLVLDVQVRVDA